MKDVISIVGIQIQLTCVDNHDLKGLPIDTRMRFFFYKGAFQNENLLFIKEKNKKYSLTPAKYKYYSKQIENTLNCPVVVILDSASYIDRTRMIEQEVYFVVGNQYASLPKLIKNIKDKPKRKSISYLSPVAQFILLRHLQSAIMEEPFGIKSIESKFPYNYLALTRGFTELEQLGLCSSKMSGTSKNLIFDITKKELWEKAQPFLRSPIKKKISLKERIWTKTSAICGINALAHYSFLNPEKNEDTAIYDKDLLKAKLDLKTLEIHDDTQYSLSVWLYPPRLLEDSEYIDRLSVALSLQNDHDPRVEKEIEIMINKLWLTE